MDQENHKTGKPLKPWYFYNESHDIYGKRIFDTENINLTWFDLNDLKIGGFTEKWPYDTPLPVYYIAKDVNYIISIDISSRIRLIDQDGIYRNEFRVFPDSEYDSENAIFCKYIELKDQLLLGLRQIYPINETRQGYTSYLALVNLAGKKIFNLQFDNWQIGDINAAPDGKHLIIPLHNYDPDKDVFKFRSVLIRYDGKIVADFPLQHKSARFNSAGNRVLFLKNEKAWIYDFDKKVLSKPIEKINSNNIFVTGCFIEDKDMFVLQEGEVNKSTSGWTFSDISLQAYDLSGNLLQQKNIDKISIYQPVLRYNQETEQLFLGHSQGWIRFDINN